MLFLLSPAKTLDYDTPVPAALQRKATEPLFTAEAGALIALMRRRTPAQVARLMELSETLAVLNVARYAAWTEAHTPTNSKPALLAFAGDVYEGLDAATLSTADCSWAQQHLVILSGLYGALRPLDRLQPYRLEMGTALANARGKDLYAWWGDRVAEHLNALQADEAKPVVVNLASQEYARVALRPTLRAHVVECVFEDTQADGTHKVISFFAKHARGRMARFAVRQRAKTVRALQGFAEDGWAFVKAGSGAGSGAGSDGGRLLFRRRFEDRPPTLAQQRAAARD